MDLHDNNTEIEEAAVLSVLAGTPIQDAAAQARTAPCRLAEAVELYRAAGRAALDARPQPAGWHQVHIEFAHYSSAERAFRTHLMPSLLTGPVAAWWFIRKHPCWRLRVRPGPDDATANAAIERVTQALDQAVTAEAVTGWRPSLYEPETVAFGGTGGMTIAHHLFHTDSIGVLDYYQDASDSTGRLPDAKTTSLLITALLLRAAGLEWGEQGDVWGQVEARRPLPDTVSTSQISSMVPTLQRLFMTDPGPALRHGRLMSLRPWAVGMERGGQTFAVAASEGRLSLGLRSILARNVLFHWNRMGFTSRQQAIWARAAREATLGR